MIAEAKFESIRCCVLPSHMIRKLSDSTIAVTETAKRRRLQKRLRFQLHLSTSFHAGLKIKKVMISMYWKYLIFLKVETIF